MKKETKQVEMDLVMFFGPLCFTDVHPAKAILLACLPALSISWGWMVLLRSLFRKSEFCK